MSKYNTAEEPIQQRLGSRQIEPNSYEKKKYYDQSTLPKKEYILYFTKSTGHGNGVLAEVHEGVDHGGQVQGALQDVKGGV